MGPPGECAMHRRKPIARRRNVRPSNAHMVGPLEARRQVLKPVRVRKGVIVDVDNNAPFAARQPTLRALPRPCWSVLISRTSYSRAWPQSRRSNHR
jgi:hypothetical protein